MKKLNGVLAITVAAILQSSPVWAESEFLPDIQQQGDIYYITGGIGDEETKAMQSERGDYNLQVMNADKAGHFSGKPHIVIKDMHHHELLNADSEPLFYANLPKGHYVVEGSDKEQTKSQNINVTGKKISYVRFVWK